MLNDSINGAGMRTRLSASDWSAAAIVAGVVMLVLTLFPYPMPHPCVWSDLAAAAGLRPQTAEFPALAPFLQRIVFSSFGADIGLGAIAVLGHVLAGLTAGCWYMAFRQMLEFGGNIDMADRQWNNRLCPAIAAGGALLVAFSELTWTASQMLTSASVDLFLAAAAFAFFFRFLARGRRHLGFLSFFFLGALAAETPYGLFLLIPVVVLIGLAWYMLDPRDDIEPAVRIKPIEEFPYALMAAAWVIGFGLVLGLADTAFRSAGGMVESFAAARAAWLRLLPEGSTMKGALLGGAVTLLPLIVVASVYPRLSHPLAPKPIWVRGLCVLAGLVALTQLIDYAPLRYRAWSDEEEAVAVAALPGIFTAIAAATVVLSSAAVAAMTWCHDSRLHIFALRFGRFLFSLAAIGLIVWVGSGRQCEAVRTKLAKVDAHIAKTLEACKGNDVIRSQGRLDPMLELRALRQNRKLVITHD